MQVPSYNSKNIKRFKKGYSDGKTKTFMYIIDHKKQPPKPVSPKKFMVLE